MTGGFELALGCDMLIGDASTKFRDTHTTFNLAPCWGLSQKLQRIIGPLRAKQVSLSAMPLSAEKALQWGLLNEVVEEGTSVLDRAIKIADEIGKNNPTMVRRYKRVMDEGGAMDLHHGLQRERELGIAHYLQALQGNTFDSAKEFISGHDRPRSKL
jgi:enoyl-CoA hydratase